ncbi:hypothetical protein I350_02931 [Cryptococcus amylolentus CBS 6273]|uniref:Uncharacterized protein n=1 Tax=Cryptococcus amylolentus CBS 6273 TaxID=1296118 RepID=A0A1E3K8D2_9TREE|nr:hypothetical protein I350_02931 [Cryptococcus amylolentus CBS 6273]
MPSTGLILLGFLPLLLLLVPWLVEPYALWDPAVLNVREGAEGRTTRWCNMGWWKETEDFSEAAESLAKKLLELASDAGYEGGGSVLVVHLSQPNPPGHLHALTSLASDTQSSKSLVESEHPKTASAVQYFTYSAEFRPGKDVGHPLDPMRGFLGERSSQRFFNTDEDEDEDLFPHPEDQPPTTGPPPYDLVYILDSAYHYPPSLSTFLSSLRPVLREISLIVYTDILPPSNLPLWQAYILSYLLSVPTPNVADRPASLGAYKAELEGQGWVDVVVEDWTEEVLPGLSGNLRKRGGAWSLVGSVLNRATGAGWRFVGVRARKGIQGTLRVA